MLRWRAYVLGFCFAGLNPLHLQPGKLQFCASFVFSYIGPYIRTWILFAWPQVHRWILVLCIVSSPRPHPESQQPLSPLISRQIRPRLLSQLFGHFNG